jgi:ELWxxDGT repeat protein
MKLINLLRQLLLVQILFSVAPGSWAEDVDSEKYSYSFELVKDIWPGTKSSLLRGFVKFNGKLYFEAMNPDNGFALWESDGTPEGTKPVKEFIPGAILMQLIEVYYGDTHYVSLENRYFERNYALNDKIYFRTLTLESGNEVWVSDGSENGTNILKDIIPGTESSGNIEPDFVAFGGKTFFTASDETSPPWNYELWATDGTESGTQVLKDITPGGSTFPRNIVALSDRLVFTTANYNLWVTDGTANGTVMQVGEFEEVYDISRPHKDQVFLYVRNPLNSYNIELWVTDGLQKIPKKVMEMPDDVYRMYFINHDVTLPNGKFLFRTLSSNGVDLWVTDGTPSGTEKLLSKGGGGGGVSAFIYNENLQKTIFVAFEDAVDGAQLWETDGTIPGTRLFKEFHPNHGVISGGIQSAEKDGFSLYFVDPTMTLAEASKEEVSGIMDEPLEFNWELWASDGTVDGTIPLNFTSKTVSRGFEFASLNADVILFERGTEETGQELWKVTRTLRNLTPAPSSVPSVSCADDESIRFFWKKKNDGVSPKLRKCKWLRKQRNRNKRRICKRKNWFKGSDPPAREVCRFTCDRCVS